MRLCEISNFTSNLARLYLNQIIDGEIIKANNMFTCNGFSPDDNFETYFEGKNPTFPKHFPFHQSGSDVSITVTL